MDWKKIKEDIAKGLKEGAETVKEGAGIVAKKAGEVSAEGQRKVKVFNLKQRIQDHMEDLGAVMYHAEQRAPGTIQDVEGVEILKKIDQANAELHELEQKDGV